MIKVLQGLLLLFSIQIGYSQVKLDTFYLMDIETKLPIDQAKIILFTNQIPSSFAISNNQGMFSIDLKKKNESSSLKISHLNYATTQQKIAELNSYIFLSPNRKLLDEIVIKAKGPPVVVRNDTIIFNADNLKGSNTYKVEDLLANIPGIQIREDGHIYYLGKQVEKVMVEGDDLTGSAYQLLTKSLSANTIQKIEIIKNFNENSLKRAKVESDKIGINLKVKKEFLNTISTSIDLSLATNKQNAESLNLIYLNPKIKSMLLMDHNTISYSSASDVNYYYYESNLNNLNESPTHESKWPIENNSIQKPPINEYNYLNSRDHFVGILGSKKIGKNAKFRYAMSNIYNRSNYDYFDKFTLYLANDSVINSLNEYSLLDKKFNQKINLGFISDNKKNRFTSVELEYNRWNISNKLDRQVTFINSENNVSHLTNSSNEIKLINKNTFKFKKDSSYLLDVNISVYGNIGKQQINSNAHELQNIYQLVDGTYFHLQNVGIRPFSFQTELASNQNVSILQIHYGALMKFEQSTYFPKLESQNLELSTFSRNSQRKKIQNISTNAFASIKFTKNRIIYWINGNYGVNFWSGNMTPVKNIHTYLLGISAKHKWSSKRSQMLSLSSKIENRNPDIYNLLPDSLILSDYRFNLSTSPIEGAHSHIHSISYRNGDQFYNRYLFEINVSHQVNKKRMALNSIFDPSFSIVYYSPNGNSAITQINFDYSDSYFNNYLGMKINLSFQNGKYDNVINLERYKIESKVYRSFIEFGTRFEGRVNALIEGILSLNNNRNINLVGSRSYSNSTKNLNFKVVTKINPSININIAYRISDLGRSGGYFHNLESSLDANINKKLYVKLKYLNILNKKQIFFTNLNLNAQNQVVFPLILANVILSVHYNL